MDKIKTGVAGLGNSGIGIHTELLKRNPNFIIEAVSDIDQVRLTGVSELYKCKSYSNFEDMCKDDAIDLVVISTNSDLHSDMTVRALHAGKNVICEKPMASNPDGASRMIKAWNETGKMLTVFHNRRLDLDFRYVMQTVRSGKIGKVFKISRNILGYSKRSDWQIWKNRGGGHLNNWGTHLIDQMLYLTEKDPELKYSKLGRILCDGDAEDYFHGIFEFEDDLSYEIELSYASMVKLPDWIVCGDKGSLTISNSEALIEYEQDGERYKEEENVEQDNIVVWQGFYNNIYNHLTKNEELLVKPGEGFKVMEIINEAKKGTEFFNGDANQL